MEKAEQIIKFIEAHWVSLVVGVMFVLGFIMVAIQMITDTININKKVWNWGQKKIQELSND